LLSFAAQAGDWPQNPQAFKAVNLVLHLLNGLLIVLLTGYLLKNQQIEMHQGQDHPWAMS
jgi:hypothetical protein